MGFSKEVILDVGVKETLFIPNMGEENYEEVTLNGVATVLFSSETINGILDFVRYLVENNLEENINDFGRIIKKLKDFDVEFRDGKNINLPIKLEDILERVPYINAVHITKKDLLNYYVVVVIFESLYDEIVLDIDGITYNPKLYTIGRLFKMDVYIDKETFEVVEDVEEEDFYYEDAERQLSNIISEAYESDRWFRKEINEKFLDKRGN